MTTVVFIYKYKSYSSLFLFCPACLTKLKIIGSATSVDVEEHLYRLARDMGITFVTSSQVSLKILAVQQRKYKFQHGSWWGTWWKYYILSWIFYMHCPHSISIPDVIYICNALFDEAHDNAFLFFIFFKKNKHPHYYKLKHFFFCLSVLLWYPTIPWNYGLLMVREIGSFVGSSNDSEGVLL